MRPTVSDVRQDVPGDDPTRRQEDEKTIGPSDRLLNVREAAAILAVRPATLYAWAYERRIPVVKLSGPRGPLRFRWSSLQRLIAQSERPALRPLPVSGSVQGRSRGR